MVSGYERPRLARSNGDSPDKGVLDSRGLNARPRAQRRADRRIGCDIRGAGTWGRYRYRCTVIVTSFASGRPLSRLGEGGRYVSLDVLHSPVNSKRRNTNSSR